MLSPARSARKIPDSIKIYRIERCQSGIFNITQFLFIYFSPGLASALAAKTGFFSLPPAIR